MGSYDTGEVRITPRRRTSASRRPTPRASTPPPAPSEPSETSSGGGGTGAGYSAGGSGGSNYDPELKTIAALGGGLTPDRIVQPVPDEVRDGTLRDVVKYLTGDDVASRTEDRAVAEAVQARMGQTNYRIILNGVQNVSSSRIEDTVTRYLNVKEQQGEDGPIKYNFVDVAIVSHDEGGKTYTSLEKLL